MHWKRSQTSKEKSQYWSKTHPIIQPHIQYGLQIWGQNISRSSRVATLQRIAVRIITFSDCNASSKPLFSQTKILSIHQYVFKLNAILTYEVLNNMSQVAVQQSLRLEYLPDSYVTRDNKKKMLKRSYVRTTMNGMLSIRYQSVIHWNILQKYFENTKLTSLRHTKFSEMLNTYLHNKYWKNKIIIKKQTKINNK